MQTGAQTRAAAALPEPAVRPLDQMARLCGEVAAVHRRAWGRGPVKTTAHWAGADILVVLLEDGHTESEKTLRAAGHAARVLAGRQVLERAIESELRSTVERIVGRTVETVLAATRLDPDVSAEIFMLAPHQAAESSRPWICRSRHPQTQRMAATRVTGDDPLS